MDDSAPRASDSTTVTAGPVTVERELEVRGHGVVAVFTVRATGGRPVRASIADYLPGNWTVSEIGFNPAFAPDDGTATVDAVRFAVDVTPGGDVVVVYGMTLAEGPDATSLTRASEFSKPVIERVDVADGVLAPDDAGPDAASSASLERADAASARDPAAFFERAGRPSGPSERPASHDAGSTPDEPGRRAREGGLVAALVEELESGEVDEATLDALEASLAERRETSLRSRIERLESRQEEFGAYVDALGELLDEHGPAVEFVTEILGSIEALEAAVEDLEAAVEAATTERAALREDLDEESDAIRGLLAAETASIREDLDEQRSALEDALEALGDDVDERTTALRADLEAETEAILDALEDETTGLRDDIEGATAARREAVADLEAAVGSIRREVETLSDRIGEWEAVRSRLLAAFRASDEHAGRDEVGIDEDEGA